MCSVWMDYDGSLSKGLPALKNSTVSKLYTDTCKSTHKERKKGKNKMYVVMGRLLALVVYSTFAMEIEAFVFSGLL